MTMPFLRIRNAPIRLCVAMFVLGLPGCFLASGQEHGGHVREVHGVPGGVPDFCAGPTAVSAASGAWSDTATWASGKIPGEGDRVLIRAGDAVTYDVASGANISCLEVHGKLSFRTDRDTRLKTANIMVQETGVLEVGTPSNPVAAGALAEIVIADRIVDRKLDPAELGNGIEALGKVTMSGAVKLPTFVRLAQEPLAGQKTMVTEQAAETWRAGDQIVIADTRQLRESERGDNYRAQDEKLEIASISGNRINLTSALKYDHMGARDADGKLEFLPHVGNLSRNVVVRSENPSGTRGHMIFMSHADVDLRYVEVREMGRTKLGVLDNTDFDAQNRVTRLGTNQIGRYGIHFHHYFGPKQPPPNGYQFTVIGVSIDGAPKWGITVHNSHYGLIQDDVVYNTKGAGIVTEDGTESFNVFDHNFSVRSQGSGEFAPASGYAGAGPDPGGEGSGFWFRGPNNYIRNNVAANGDVFGFDLAAGSLGKIRIPKFKGADMADDRETAEIDTTGAKVLEFSNNEAYGTIQTGVAFGWNGEISNFRTWNPSRHGVTATPADTLTVENLTVRGDKTVLADALESPTGVWIANYIAKSVTIENADIQGMRAGIASPFFRADQRAEPGRGDGSVKIENGRFRDYVGVVVATAYTTSRVNGRPLKRAVVRDSLFEPLGGVRLFEANPPASVSMNYRMAPDDPEPRDPVEVYGFNKQAGDDFKVYYSLDPNPKLSPCKDTRQGIGGWVCK
ncbi:MAG TPA: G8 domain-containing protein [Bryobacteraceae bacterium]|nr:G8 domain-containing protein [Bryobacteraceae bacterium]